MDKQKLEMHGCAPEIESEILEYAVRPLRIGTDCWMLQVAFSDVLSLSIELCRMPGWQQCDATHEPALPNKITTSKDEPRFGRIGICESIRR